ncbi:hypothetical protein L218DRAFT_767552 [Marasmius fiardii PR-910]|nr:hypothetical protein L218DRAFT_767552 [Marasmius fiardii PR-910]
MPFFAGIYMAWLTHTVIPGICGTKKIRASNPYCDTIHRIRHYRSFLWLFSFAIAKMEVDFHHRRPRHCTMVLGVMVFLILIETPARSTGIFKKRRA